MKTVVPGAHRVDTLVLILTSIIPNMRPDGFVDADDPGEVLRLIGKQHAGAIRHRGFEVDRDLKTGQVTAVIGGTTDEANLAVYVEALQHVERVAIDTNI